MLKQIDVITKDGFLTGKQSNPEEVNKLGLWHQGVRAIIYTSDGKVLVQKRSDEIIKYPGYIDMSIGGYVDAGESPEQALIREMREEYGLKVKPTNLKYIGYTRYNHQWRDRKAKKTSRILISNYVVRLEHADIRLILQKSEVSWAGFISLRSARRLLTKHRIKQLGRLVPLYGHIGREFDAVVAELSTRK